MGPSGGTPSQCKPVTGKRACTAGGAACHFSVPAAAPIALCWSAVGRARWRRGGGCRCTDAVTGCLVVVGCSGPCYPRRAPAHVRARLLALVGALRMRNIGCTYATVCLSRYCSHTAQVTATSRAYVRLLGRACRSHPHGSGAAIFRAAPPLRAPSSSIKVSDTGCAAAPRRRRRSRPWPRVGVVRGVDGIMDGGACAGRVAGSCGVFRYPPRGGWSR